MALGDLQRERFGLLSPSLCFSQRWLLLYGLLQHQPLQSRVQVPPDTLGGFMQEKEQESGKTPL